MLIGDGAFQDYDSEGTEDMDEDMEGEEEEGDEMDPDDMSEDEHDPMEDSEDSGEEDYDSDRSGSSDGDEGEEVSVPWRWRDVFTYRHVGRRNVAGLVAYSWGNH